MLQEEASQNEGHVELDRPLARFKHNDRVMIVDGPFKGWQGLVDTDHHSRVRLLLDIMGRSTPIFVARESVALCA